MDAFIWVKSVFDVSHLVRVNVIEEIAGEHGGGDWHIATGQTNISISIDEAEARRITNLLVTINPTDSPFPIDEKE